MVDYGWITNHDDAVARLEEVLKFFGVVSPNQWEELWREKSTVSFRKSKLPDKDEIAVTAWLRKGEIEAKKVDCKPYNEDEFRTVLKEVRARTIDKPSPELYQDTLVDYFREAGVAFVVVPKLPKIPIFGASRWLTPTKALIQVSLYYKHDDNFWFTIFHEAAHLLLHSKKTVFVDFDPKKQAGKTNLEEEAEANGFAENFLIPPDALTRFKASKVPTDDGYLKIHKQQIIEFAKLLGIAPSIIVGRLHHEKSLHPKNMRKLKTKIDWTDDNKICVVEPSELKYW